MSATSSVYSYKGTQLQSSPKSWQWQNGGKRILFGHWVLSGDQTGSVLESGDPGGSIAFRYVIHNIDKTQVWISPNSDIDLKKSKPLREWYGDPNSDKADITLENGHTIQVRLGNPDKPESEDQSLHVFLNGRDLDSEPDHNDTRTPLHWACGHGRVVAIKRLIESGADVNAKAKFADYDELTPLYLACSFGHVDAAKLLIESGADVNAKAKFKGNDGFTPLHNASYYGHVDAAKLLIEMGADVYAKDHEGDTPLRCAMKGGHQELAFLMVKEEMKLLGFSGPRQESTAERVAKEGAKTILKVGLEEIVKAALGGM